MLLPGDFLARLATWLPTQRWFAGKGRPIDRVTILADACLANGDPGLRHVIIGVHQSGSMDRYQLLIGLRRYLPLQLQSAEITREAFGSCAYDAVYDPELTQVWLTQFATNARPDHLSFHLVPGSTIESTLPGRLRIAEQSNTSIIFGDAYICKLFRRVSQGTSPDLKLNIGLTQTNCPHVPKLYGWAEDQAGATLALLSQYLPDAIDGWELATASAHDFLFGPNTARKGARIYHESGSFAAEAERLGAVTATVQDHLARAFGVTALSASEVGDLAARMRTRLAEAIAIVPQLGTVADQIAMVFNDLAGLGTVITAQRVHGDLHLAQLLRTQTGWMMVDFEGEPYRTALERSAWAHPLRDVAGMLRSFDYAARYLLISEEDALVEMSGLTSRTAAAIQLKAEHWARVCRTAYCRGYARFGGPNPSAHKILLRAFEYDKLIYEVLFEARHRPSWLSIPLSVLARQPYDS
jgi:maltokinase